MQPYNSLVCVAGERGLEFMKKVDLRLCLVGGSGLFYFSRSTQSFSRPEYSGLVSSRPS
jgi:hypothetical protein